MPEKIVKVTYGQAVELKNVLERAMINGGLDPVQQEAYEMVCAWVTELEPEERVVFRKFKDGEVIALFPDQYSPRTGMIGSYMHNGQHSDTQPHVGDTTPAEYHQYHDLYMELKRQGYKNLKVVTRLNVKR